MSKFEANTFFIKIKGNKFLSFRDSFIDSIKQLEVVESLEPQQNQFCFYVDTTDVEWFINFLTNLKQELHEKNYGDLIYSRIHNVYAKKDMTDESPNQEKKKAF